MEGLILNSHIINIHPTSYCPNHVIYVIRIHTYDTISQCGFDRRTPHLCAHSLDMDGSDGIGSCTLRCNKLHLTLFYEIARRRNKSGEKHQTHPYIHTCIQRAETIQYAMLCS